MALESARPHGLPETLDAGGLVLVKHHRVELFHPFRDHAEDPFLNLLLDPPLLLPRS
jgi:hypothetical protein